MGPRQCLGMRLAQVEILAVAVVLLKRVDWAPAPKPRPRRKHWRLLLASVWGRGQQPPDTDATEEGQGGPSLDVRYPGAATFRGGVRLQVMGRRPDAA